jgi:hypothetical protein
LETYRHGGQAGCGAAWERTFIGCAGRKPSQSWLQQYSRLHQRARFGRIRFLV